MLSRQFINIYWFIEVRLISMRLPHWKVNSRVTLRFTNIKESRLFPVDRLLGLQNLSSEVLICRSRRSQKTACKKWHLSCHCTLVPSFENSSRCFNYFRQQNCNPFESFRTIILALPNDGTESVYWDIRKYYKLISCRSLWNHLHMKMCLLLGIKANKGNWKYYLWE